MEFEPSSPLEYPFMLVNIGSGVSILKISGEGQFERISGTSLGGGTLCGLLAMLTGAQTYDEMLDLSKRGNNLGVDLSVGDIYGGDYNKACWELGNWVGWIEIEYYCVKFWRDL
jgi:pantothenate kinase